MDRPDFLYELRNLVETQRAKGYKPAWVWHQVKSAFAPFSESELQHIAVALGYKSGWVWHELKSQQQTQQVYQPPSQLQKNLNLLELNIPFTMEELKRSYKAKALKLHPDTGGSQESFVALSEAYKYLRNYLSVEGVA